MINNLQISDAEVAETIQQEDLAGKKMSNKNKAFWITQISGWLLMLVVNVLILNYSSVGLTWQRFVITLTIVFTGFITTTIFRHLVKKYKWISLSLPKVLLIIIVGGLVQGLIMLGLFAPLNYYLKAYVEEAEGFVDILAHFLNFSSLYIFWALIYFTYHYFDISKKAQIESLIWEAAVKDFELKTLKSQLNPHFMFNAMNSIRALIEEDPENAKNALTKLSNILRYSLKIERIEKVSLEEEMNVVKDYLELERIRFEERLRFKVELAPDTLNIYIPPMMIQTLAENAIKHGISKLAEGGIVNITSETKNGKVVIKIQNTGMIVEEALKNAEGFGVANTKHRLNLIYGDEAVFNLKNKDENLVEAELVIPLNFKEKY